ncbi:MAG: hypothetical protein LBQ52_09445 [Helicobacteraceae bacterium]|jgi:hypothetical protein|nr:hypothetical protein [Helicobacteraceae bacterium]
MRKLSAVWLISVCITTQLHSDELISDCKDTELSKEEKDFACLFSYECFYEKATLAQVYAGYQSGKIGDIGKEMRAVLEKSLDIGKNLRYHAVTPERRKYDDGPLLVTYSWKGKNEVSISFSHFSDETYTFKQEKDGVSVRCLLCSD